MANLHAQNTTPENNNQEPSKFPWDFLGRYDCMIVVGRTREVNGEILYEVEDIKYQIENKDDDRNRIKISEGEYKYIKAEYDQHIERKNFEEKLKKTGHMSGCGFESGETYSRLLLDVLDANKISKIDEMSDHIEKQKKIEEVNIEYHYAFDDKYCGLRYYIRNNKTIYECELPLSEQEYFEVSEEVYMDHYNRQKKQLEVGKNTQEEQHKKRAVLNSKGYTKEATHGGDRNYQDQLLKILDNQNIPTVGEIPEHIEQQNIEKYTAKNEIMKQQEPDFYEQNIINLLDEYEKIIENNQIEEENIMKIAEFFTKGNIKNLELFHRFEKLKKANIINHFKRIYLYGSKRTTSKPNKQGFTRILYGYNDIERDYINKMDFEGIGYFVTHMGGNLSDIEPNYEIFVAKTKKGYQKEWTKFLTGETVYFSERKGFSGTGFSKHSLNQLGIDDETTHKRREEGSQKFIEEFKIIIENKINEDNRDSIVLIINKIEENFRNISTEKGDIESVRENIIELLEKQIYKNIDSIKNKEKPTKAERGNKGDLSYKRQIEKKVGLTNALYKQLSLLSPERAKAIGREENRESYIEEYKNFFRDNFINKRKEAWSIDISSLEAVKQKVIPEVKNKFYKSVKKRGDIREKKQETKVPTRIDGKRGNRLILKLMNAAWFHTGNALLMKTAYPDDKERRKIRQEYIQIITKEIITEIQEKITKEETFDMAEYYMINPINHVYKSYGGKGSIAKISNETKKILDNLTKENFKIEGENHLSIIGEMLNKKIKTEEGNHENNKQLYGSIKGFRDLCYRYISYFLKDINIFKGTWEEQITIAREENAEWIGIIPESCIDDTTTMGFKLNELEKYLDPNIFETYINFYKKLDIYREQIIERILQSRFFRNGKAGGKLQRVIEDKLIEQFGLITMDSEQNTFIIEYLKGSLSSIILNDLSTGGDKLYLSETDIQKIETYINEYMKNIGHKITLERQAPKALQ